MIILDKNHKNIIKVDNHYELLEFPSLEKDYEIRLDKVLHILAPISKSSININSDNSLLFTQSFVTDASVVSKKLIVCSENIVASNIICDALYAVGNVIANTSIKARHALYADNVNARFMATIPKNIGVHDLNVKEYIEVYGEDTIFIDENTIVSDVPIYDIPVTIYGIKSSRFGIAEAEEFGYEIVFLDSHILIGCQAHPILDWTLFDAEEIAKMDGELALEFWDNYRDIILDIAKGVKNGKA